MAPSPLIVKAKVLVVVTAVILVAGAIITAGWVVMAEVTIAAISEGWVDWIVVFTVTIVAVVLTVATLSLALVVTNRLGLKEF